jgi:alpha-L-arabinofuranosidase
VNHLVIHAGQGKQRISKQVYGHFAEHLGRGIEAELHCEVRNALVAAVTGTVLSAEEMGAHNTFQDPERVRPVPFEEEIQVEAENVTVVLPPMSVSAFTIRVS